jgi:hypothetical protein
MYPGRHRTPMERNALLLVLNRSAATRSMPPCPASSPFGEGGAGFILAFETAPLVQQLQLESCTLRLRLLNIFNLMSKLSCFCGFNGATSGSGVILRSDGGITGTFGTIVYDGNGSAGLAYTTNEITVSVIDATSVVAGNLASLQTALSFFDQAGTEQIARYETGDAAGNQWRVSVAHNCGSRLWAKGFGQRGNEDASDGNRAFAYQAGGAAVGGDAEVGRDLRFGASLGASLTEEELAGAVSEASANGLFATLYSSLEKGRGFAKPNGFEVIAESYDAAEETPTAVMVRQILGAVSQFEKASLVAQLKGARDRKRQRASKCKGRRSHAEVNPALVADVRKLRRANPKTGKRLSCLGRSWLCK